MDNLNQLLLLNQISFKPQIIKDSEFLTSPATFEYFDVDGNKMTIDLPEKSLAMTFCQVPIIFEKTGEQSLEINFANDETKLADTMKLPCELSREIFERNGKIKSIEVEF